jgi:hypothetical protein
MDAVLVVFLQWLPVRELLKTRGLLFTSKGIRRLTLDVYDQQKLRDYIWRHYGEKLQQALLTRLAATCVKNVKMQRGILEEIGAYIPYCPVAESAFALIEVKQHGLFFTNNPLLQKLQDIVWVIAFFDDPPIGESISVYVEFGNGNPLKRYSTICDNYFIQFPMLDGRAGLLFKSMNHVLITCQGKEGQLYYFTRFILTGKCTEGPFDLLRSTPYLTAHRYSTTLEDSTKPPWRARANHRGVYVNDILTADGMCILRFST